MGDRPFGRHIVNSRGKNRLRSNTDSPGFGGRSPSGERDVPRFTGQDGEVWHSGPASGSADGNGVNSGHAAQRVPSMRSAYSQPALAHRHLPRHEKFVTPLNEGTGPKCQDSDEPIILEFWSPKMKQSGGTGAPSRRVSARRPGHAVPIAGSLDLSQTKLACRTRNDRPCVATAPPPQSPYPSQLREFRQHLTVRSRGLAEIRVWYIAHAAAWTSPASDQPAGPGYSTSTAERS